MAIWSFWVSSYNKKYKHDWFFGFHMRDWVNNSYIKKETIDTKKQTIHWAMNYFSHQNEKLLSCKDHQKFYDLI